MILRPQKNFTLVRQIANHTDTATYYVRAVIRDAYTDEILDTLNLDDKGGQRFSKNWRVVADPSGLGREISIVTSVYTDSGYTTKSENYGDEENSHLIEDKEVNGRSGGGGIDARTLRRIIKEEIELARPEPIEIPEFPEPKEYEMRWDDILKAISELPKPQSETNINPILDGLKNLANLIEQKEVTPPTDLSPVLDHLKDSDDNQELNKDEVVTMLNTLANILVKQIPNEIKKILKDATFNMVSMKAEIDLAEKKIPVKEIDISKITL